MFNGSVLREWIYHCEQLFSIDSTLPELKVHLASLHMTCKALQWHHSCIANHYNIFPLWPEYVAAVLARIGELYDDPLSELVSLKQGNDTIEIYLEKLDCAVNRITLAPGHALKAARIAKLHELSIQHTLVRTLPPTFNSSRSNFSQPNKNQFSTSTPPTTNAVGNQNNKPPPLQHTSETGHQLKHRRAELLFLEADTEFDEEIALEEQIRETTLDEDNKWYLHCLETLTNHLVSYCFIFTVSPFFESASRVSSSGIYLSVFRLRFQESDDTNGKIIFRDTLAETGKFCRRRHIEEVIVLLPHTWSNPAEAVSSISGALWTNKSLQDAS
ncbi:hypothetical protein F2Q69_00055376 [Brassica cretica]|uniref:Uncharacterized protein n=1 Tax=Brassica cretica TaxID=69181 RepID=A0A8S9N3L2_BRACR|nr:hypothetical protein F2Q69_00055376 [Brassica cretica]